jgi:hypothetical protein
MRDPGVYAVGARTTRVYPLGRRRDVLGSVPSGARKRVYPLRKRREVLESTPSGRGQRQFAEEDARSRDEGSWSLRLRGEDSTNSLIEEEAGSRDEGYWSLRLRGEDDTSLSTEEETRRSGVCAFGARTAPIR